MFLIAHIPGIVLLLPIVIMNAGSLAVVPGKVWILVTAAGFFQALYFSGLAGAYRHGDLSVAYPVVRATPVFIVMVITSVIGQGEQISPQAIIGIILVGIAAFFLPMREWGDFRFRNYFNLMSAFALLAACGTTGYSIVDDAALRILRLPEVMGGDVSVGGISFFYLFFEVTMTMPFLAGFFLLERKFSKKPANEKTGYRHFLYSIFLGVMIAGTYGIVLAAMAYSKNVSYIVAFRQLSLPIGVFLGLVILKERGSLLRFTAVLLMVAGLVLASIS